VNGILGQICVAQKSDSAMAFPQQIGGCHITTFHIVNLNTVQFGMWIFNENGRQPMIDQAAYLSIIHWQRKNDESIQFPVNGRLDRYPCK
jgi:hypothetical protein